MIKLSSSVYSLFFFIGLLLYRVALDFTYYLVIAPNFEYMGFKLDPGPYEYALSWAIYVLCSSMLSSQVRRLSDICLLLAFSGLIAPLSSLYGLSGASVFPFLVSVLAVGIFYFLTRNVFKVMAPSLPYFTEGKGLTLSVSLVLVIFLVFWYVISGAVQYINFDITRVYEFRAESAKLANLGILAYLNSWIYQVITLFLLAAFLLSSRFIPAFLILVVQVFFFSVAGHKSLLFYPFLILGVWIYFRRTGGVLSFPFIMVLVISLCVSVYYIWGNIWPTSLFVRRSLFVPAVLTYDYFSFFSDAQMVYWSNSVLSGFMDYPYDQSIPILIGEYNGTNAGANNGFISSGYAHAGVLGVVFYSIIFSAFVILLEKYSSSLPLWFAIAVTIIPLRSAIVSSDLFTVILTHGLLLTLLLLIFYRLRGVSPRSNNCWSTYENCTYNFSASKNRYQNIR